MDKFSRMILRGFCVIVVLGGCVNIVTANNCYVCNSALDGNCADPSRLGNLYRDCSATAGSAGNRCIKIMGPGTLVSRDCGSAFGSGNPDGCTSNGNIQTCTCSSNYCNLSTKTNSAMGILGLLTIAGCVALCSNSF